MIVIMFVQRRLGIGLDFFSVAWALVITILITRFLGSRIDYERPFGQVVRLFLHEVTGPRQRTAVRGGEVRSGHVRVVRPRSARHRRKNRSVRQTHMERWAAVRHRKGRSRVTT
jgi:hypothetical protein